LEEKKLKLYWKWTWHSFWNNFFD